MKKIKNNKKLLLITLAGLFVIGSAGAYGFYQNKGANNSEPDASGEPESIVADPNFSDGTERTPSQSYDHNGSVRDTSGEDSNTDNSPDPIVSDEGNISVITPQQNHLLKPGDKVAGTAKVERVYFRLIDDKVGVLTQGSLKVVNGRFSGVFDFETNGTNGRLDIFRTLEGGVEADVIEINVKFK